VGVDTHKDIHVAVAIDEHGAQLGSGSFTADRAGYTSLISWATSWGVEVVFGVEGTGSYGAGLASAIRRSGIGVLEVLRTDRRDRRLRGKSDAIDAENAARSVLAGLVHAIPKSADGIVEMIRVTKVAKDNAVKARTSAMISLKQVLVNADDDGAGFRVRDQDPQRDLEIGEDPAAEPSLRARPTDCQDDGG